MALYIKDEAVDDLAIRFQQATGAASKTAAVRKALQDGLAALQRKQPLMVRIAALQSQADKIGPADPNFDQKEFSDGLLSDD